MREVEGDGLALIDAWRGFGRAIVVDAVVSGAKAGTLHRLEGRRLPEVESLRLASTHAVGVRESIALASLLGLLPPALTLLGIEAGSLDEGASLTLAVEESIGRAASAVLEEIGECNRMAPATTSGSR